MYLQEPRRPSPTSRFGCEIDIWIEKELRPSSVHGNIHSNLHPKRLGTQARHFVGEETGKCQTISGRQPKRPNQLHVSDRIFGFSQASIENARLAGTKIDKKLKRQIK